MTIARGEEMPKKERLNQAQTIALIIQTATEPLTTADVRDQMRSRGHKLEGLASSSASIVSNLNRLKDKGLVESRPVKEKELRPYCHSVDRAKCRTFDEEKADGRGDEHRHDRDRDDDMDDRPAGGRLRAGRCEVALRRRRTRKVSRGEDRHRPKSQIQARVARLMA